MKSDIKNLFSKYGETSNIVIPIIPKPRTTFRYAFIRYVIPSSMHAAIQAMDGVKLEGRILKVQQAKFDKPLTKLNHIVSSPIPSPTPQKTTFHLKSSLRDHRSYREVSSPNPQKPLKPIVKPPPNQPQTTLENKIVTNFPSKPPSIYPSLPSKTPLSQFQEQDPLPEFFHKNPSKAQMFSAKILGEATKEARENLIAENIDDEFSLVISGSRNLDNLDLFNRSLVAVAQSSMFSIDIIQCFFGRRGF